MRNVVAERTARLHVSPGDDVVEKALDDMFASGVPMAEAVESIKRVNLHHRKQESTQFHQKLLSIKAYTDSRKSLVTHWARDIPVLSEAQSCLSVHRLPWTKHCAFAQMVRIP